AVELAIPSGALIEVAGGTYGPLLLNRDNVSLRAWPGTGRPIIDATGRAAGITARAANLLVDGFEVFGGGEHGITINGARNQGVTVRRVEVRECGFADGMFNNHSGLMVNNDATDVVIEDSVFRDNVTTIAGRICSGLHVNSGIRVLVRGNELRGNSQHGLFLAISSDVVVESNVFVDNGQSGARLAETDAVFRNNVVCDTEGIGVEMLGDRPIRVASNTILRSAQSAVVALEDSEKRVESNILAFSGEFGLVAGDDADLVADANLYFENAMGDASGFALDSEGNVFADPLLLSDRCDPSLAEASPALAADIGAR
ncbi:MAG: right-handed parallel beta-helix repeat-containing protein, partial [Myxococcota bacterium]